MINLAGIIFALVIMLCIIWEIATTDNHEGAFFALGSSLLLGFVLFYGLM